LTSLSYLRQDLSNVETQAAVGSQALVENDCDLKRINQTLELSAGFEVAVRNAGSLITVFMPILSTTKLTCRGQPCGPG
jgi:hypothetical protein